MTLVLLVRHGQTDWNLAGRVQGTSDIPLNDTGRDQARALASRLAQHEWQGLYTSPLSRAHETATIIASQTGFGEPTVIGELRERDYGEAEGLNAEEIRERFPEAVSFPGRETIEQVVERVMPPLRTLAEDNPGSALIVTTHGAVIRQVLNHVVGYEQFHRGVPITNASAHSLWFGDGDVALIEFDTRLEQRPAQLG